MTQTQQIKEYMSIYGSITPIDAIREFGCMRLGARIYDLERQGVEIIHETEHSINRFGKKVSYARYRLASQVA